MDTDPEFMQYALNYFTPKRKSLNSGRFCEYIRRQPHSIKLSTEAIQNIFYECIRCIRRQPDHALAGWASHQIIPPRIPTLPPYDGQKSTRLRKQQLKHEKSKQVSPDDESDVTIFDFSTAVPDEVVYSGSLAPSHPVQELDVDGDNEKDHDDRSYMDNNENSDYSMVHGSSPFVGIASTADSKSGSPQVHHDVEGLHKISMSPGNQNKSPSPHLAQSSPRLAQPSPPRSSDNILEQRLTSLESSLSQFLNTFSQSLPNSESTRNLLLNSLTTDNPLPFHGDAKADAELYLTGKRSDFLLYLHLYGLDPAHVTHIINPLAIHVINVYATQYLFHQRLQVAFEGFLTKLEKGIRMGIDSGIGIGSKAAGGMSYLSVETAHSARVFLDEVHALQKESLNSN